jgi:hypothetical protein
VRYSSSFQPIEDIELGFKVDFIHSEESRSRQSAFLCEVVKYEKFCFVPFSAIYCIKKQQVETSTILFCQQLLKSLSVNPLYAKYG